MTGAPSPNRVGGGDGGTDQHGRASGGAVGGGWALPTGGTGGQGAHPRRAVRDDGLASQACGAPLRRHGTVGPGGAEERPSRKRTYDATIQNAVTAPWEAADRVCGNRLVAMIPSQL